jgi:hypothetical protein
MADGFIVRRGGITDATPAPTISFVSKTEDSVTFTITNNSLKARDITYGLTTPPTTTTINLAGGATSTNQTISDITDFVVTIFAQAEDSAITEFRVRLEFPPVYTAATGGTTEEYNLDGKRYKSHTFTSNGTFEVTTAGNGDRNQVDYLIIAGGGGGAFFGGAGGAGGYRTTFGTQGGNGTLDPKVTVTATSYGVTVGTGGAGATTLVAGSSGTNSEVAFSPTIISLGGGGGQSSSISGTGITGGSGGGNGPRTSTGGSGTANQGTDGGNGFTTTATDGGSGGGGGAGEAGADGTLRTGGKGGDGLASVIRTGSSETRAGGGGGAGDDRTGTATNGDGGAGGGGAGGTTTSAVSGTVNTGSGGGGGRDQNGGSGGSGIVIIRYEIAPTV